MVRWVFGGTGWFSVVPLGFRWCRWVFGGAVGFRWYGWFSVVLVGFRWSRALGFWVTGLGSGCWVWSRVQRPVAPHALPRLELRGALQLLVWEHAR